MFATAPDLTDELIRRAADGDQRAFEDLIGPYLDLGFRLAVTLLGDAAAAEDAVQEATFKAWRHLRRMRGGTSVRPWFLTVVANECRTQRRGRWCRVLRGVDEPRPAASAEFDPATWDLHQALLSLDGPDRAALFLRYYEDLPVRDVAVALGISTTAARSRIHRALRRLRLELDDEEVAR